MPSLQGGSSEDEELLQRSLKSEVLLFVPPQRLLTLYCSRFFSLLVSVSSRSLLMAAICLFLSLMAWSSDLSSFLIHLSRSSLEVNWLPRPCLAYRSVLSWVAWASLVGATVRPHHLADNFNLEPFHHFMSSGEYLA